MIDTYRQQALQMDQKGIERQDLIRNIKASEANYLLYVQKEEQARISDEMDKNRILNVAIAETPGVPAFPVFSPWLLLLAGCVLALMLSTAAAFVADYFDPSFRTPEEVSQYLGLPMLASFAKNGHGPRFGLPPAGGGSGEIETHSPPGGAPKWVSLVQPLGAGTGKAFWIRGKEDVGEAHNVPAILRT